MFNSAPNSRYRMFNPAVFGQTPEMQQMTMPPVDAQSPLMPWPSQQQDSPGLGQAIMGGAAQMYAAIKQRRMPVGGLGAALGSQENY